MEDKKSREFNLPDGFGLDTPICRVFQKDHLLGMIEARQNILVKLSKWDDPYEFFLGKQTLNLYGEKVSLHMLFDDFYGQCWSLNQKETDATWRIYSPDKTGVLVKTTLEKLWDKFYRFSGLPPEYFGIGRVQYKEQNDIVSFYENIDFCEILPNDSDQRQIFSSLMIKRMEFEHEQELRIVYSDCKDRRAVSGLVGYPVEPQEFIEKLVADPRMEDKDFCKLKMDLGKLGFGNRLEQSTLYQLPKMNLRCHCVDDVG